TTVQRLGELQRHHSHAAEADDEQRAVAGAVEHLPERAVGGEAGAHVASRKLRIDTACVEQVARVGDDDVRRVTAVNRDAEVAGDGAQVFVAAPADPAAAAAGPRVHGEVAANLDAVGFRSDGLDDAGDLVAERERQLASAAHVELLAVAEIEIAVMHVDVAVTHA